MTRGVVRAVFFDLGGTLVSPNDRWAPGARRALAALRAAGVRLGILSNTGDLRREELLARLPADFDFAAFDAESIVLSSETDPRLEKPDERIFLLAVERSGQRAEECLYCSESCAEVSAARRAGLRASRIRQPSGPDFASLVHWLAAPAHAVAAAAQPAARYRGVLEILDAAIGGPGANIGFHGAFWRGLSRDQFVVRKVYGRQLLVVGDGASSLLMHALKGIGLFGADLPQPPPEARYSRMPVGFPPVPDEQVAFVERWIDDGCPDDAPEGGPPADDSGQPGETGPPPDKPPAAELRWRPTGAPVASSRTDDIWFVSPEEGWAANSNGQIIHTADGGRHWDVQLHDPEVYFRCLGFATPLRGWAGTLEPGKTLFETADGGRNWSLVANLPALAPPAICGLSVVDELVAYAAGTNYPHRPPRMMKTLDGGRAWIAWDMRPWADILIDTYFTDPLRGWVVGGKTDQPRPTRQNVRPVVLRTEDGGRTWENRVADLKLELPLGEWGWKIQFLDDQNGFVSLENFQAGAILRTDDGGRSWRRLPINDPQANANLEGVGFVDADHGWVGGWGDAAFERRSSSETLDGGLTWRDANEIGRAINRFRFFGRPVAVGYASGETVYKYSAEPPPPVAALAARQKVGRCFADLAPLEAQGEARVSIHVPPGVRKLTVRVWDRFGERVATPMEEDRPAAGERTIVWRRRDDAGKRLPAGIFIWRVTVDAWSESRLVRIT